MHFKTLIRLSVGQRSAEVQRAQEYPYISLQRMTMNSLYMASFE